MCAGPGGFSEYVLWKRRWHAKGFGMTLKGPCDFKLEDFYAAPSELFEPYYGTPTVEKALTHTHPVNLSSCYELFLTFWNVYIVESVIKKRQFLT